MIETLFFGVEFDNINYKDRRVNNTSVIITGNSFHTRSNKRTFLSNDVLQDVFLTKQ